MNLKKAKQLRRILRQAHLVKANLPREFVEQTSFHPVTGTPFIQVLPATARYPEGSFQRAYRDAKRLGRNSTHHL